MMQQLFLPLTLLLCWNTEFYFMILLMHLLRMRTGAMQMVILFTMLNIHAGILEYFVLDVKVAIIFFILL